ncbi:MAG TPA: glycosyltransferase family 2 protein [Terricaulis sp.]|nr:glycosyltransferase family 2 protein [Terricaulis sp.]
MSVLIVCYNSRAHFARLKASLEAQTIRFNLYVVDNASAVEQRPRADDFPAGARIIQNEDNRGFAAANNQLAALDDAEFIALLNPDAFPEPRWLEHLLAGAARHPRAGAFGSTQIMADDESRYDGLGDCLSPFGAAWRGGRGARRQDIPPLEGETFSVCAAAALYRRAAWDAAGGFDESFFCFIEDVDLGLRLRLKGWASVQIAEAVVAHVGGGASSSAFAAYHAARNTIWCLAQSMPGAIYWPLLPAHALLTLIFYLRSFGDADGKAYRRGVRDACKAIGERWRTRRLAQADADARGVARMLTWSLAAMRARAPNIKPTR